MSGPFYAVVPQYGELAYTAVDGTDAATADAVITLTRDRRTIIIVSNLNAEVMVTHDASDFVHVPANGTVALDLGSNSLAFASGTVLKVYHRGTAPTSSGRIGITAL